MKKDDLNMPLLAFASGGDASALILLKHPADITDPHHQIVDLSIYKILRKPSYRLPDILSELDIVAPLLRDILGYRRGVIPSILDTSF